MAEGAVWLPVSRAGEVRRSAAGGMTGRGFGAAVACDALPHNAVARGVGTSLGRQSVVVAGLEEINALFGDAIDEAVLLGDAAGPAT